MGFLQFVVTCFDLLAWPVFALGYPLCASVQAIETNSNSDIMKLITYWILFSLVALFEHAFSKLLQWVPFWPHMKLVIICCLAIPQFDGAFYVYKHFVHKYLLAEPQSLINWLAKKQFSERENFLVEAERYIKENGSEALEKLIAGKVEQKDIIAVEETKQKEVASVKRAAQKEPNITNTEAGKLVPSKLREATAAAEVKDRITLLKHAPKDNLTETSPSLQVTQKVPNKVQTEAQSSPPVEIKEATPTAVSRELPGIPVPKHFQQSFSSQASAGLLVAQKVPTSIQTEANIPVPVEIREATAAVAGGDLPEMAVSKQVQREWTCAICQVTTQSETTLNSHLQGKRHKATCEQLKANNLASKAKVSFAEATKKSAPSKLEPGDCSSRVGIADTVIYNDKKPAYLLKKEPEKCLSGNTATHKVLKQTGEKVKGQKMKVKNNSVEFKHGKYWCNICSIRCTCMENMESHLASKKHLAKTSAGAELVS